MTRPPEDFWIDVPCGHPPEPVAWLTESGPVCHCGRMVEDQGYIIDGRRVVPCGGCGCAVEVPRG